MRGHEATEPPGHLREVGFAIAQHTLREVLARIAQMSLVLHFEVFRRTRQPEQPAGGPVQRCADNRLTRMAKHMHEPIRGLGYTAGISHARPVDRVARHRPQPSRVATLAAHLHDESVT